MDLILISIIIIFIYLIGYVTGKKRGAKEGFDKGIHVAPLKLRKQMLIFNKCPICDRNN